MKKSKKTSSSSSSDIEYVPSTKSSKLKSETESDIEIEIEERRRSGFIADNSDSLSDTNSKNKLLDESDQDISDETEFESSSESNSPSDIKFELAPDSPSKSDSDDFTNAENEADFLSDSESSFHSDLDSEPNIPQDEIDKIIGINQPMFSSTTTPLMFYVKYKDKSYKWCEWITRKEVCNTKRGNFLYNQFKKYPTPFRQVPFYNQINTMTDDGDYAKSEERHQLYKPSDIEFDRGFITAEKVLSIQRKIKNKKFLIKWRSLDISESTWEADAPADLIEEFEESNENTHSVCYDHEINANKRKFEIIRSSANYKNDHKLTDYQVEGLNWLQFCWFEERNSILADEMGLGKTIESISILVSLSEWYPDSWGPFLVVCPLSTITNWLDEFEQWTNFRVVCLMGDQKSRQMLKQYLIFHHMKSKNKLDRTKIIFDVLIVSYEWLSRELPFIRRFNFMYTIIDEAQRIKNSKSMIYQTCQSIRSYHILLMTGTPIQNNLFELWSLLHFISPINFEDYDEFNNVYGIRGDADKVEQLQEIIRPFIFRRKKNDVNLRLPDKDETIIEVEMTQIQRTFSQLIIKDNIDVLSDISALKVNLNNVMMQLRKLFCHPFLFPNLESISLSNYRESHHIPDNVPLTEEDEINSLILASGKTILIDKLLPKLKAGNHKVLIFSQMTRMLDIIEDYLVFKQYQYSRLDGSCSTSKRSLSIERFQNDEDVFVFLLSTRAGGLGINLTQADTVIIYDNDWNPQNDIQAQARCHRIGQTKKVNVYRLITRGCYESEMFDRASKKLGLDFAILDSNPQNSVSFFDRNTKKNNAETKMKSKMELQMILRKGAYYTFNDDPSEIDKFCSENIDQILENRSHTMKDLVSGGNSRFSKVSFNANESNEETEILKRDFWKNLAGSQNDNNEKNKISDDEVDFDLNSGIKTRPKAKRKVYTEEFKSDDFSSDSEEEDEYTTESYYSNSDNEFVPKGSKDNEEEDDDSDLEIVPDEDEDDLPPPMLEDDDDVIYINKKPSKQRNLPIHDFTFPQFQNSPTLNLINAPVGMNSTLTVLPGNQKPLSAVNTPPPPPYSRMIPTSLLFQQKSSTPVPNATMYQLLTGNNQYNSILSIVNNQSNSVSSNVNNQSNSVSAARNNPSTSISSTVYNQSNSVSSKSNNQVNSDLKTESLEFNQSLPNSETDLKIFVNALNYIKFYGITGSRLFASEFIREMGKILITLVYDRLPNSIKSIYTGYIKEHIPDQGNQSLKTLYKQFSDNNYISSLFRGQESIIIGSAASHDYLYKVALYVSNTQLPPNFEFVPELYSPNGWTAIDDFIAISASPFCPDTKSMLEDDKLPFKSLIQRDPSLSNWISKRIFLLFYETSKIVPSTFTVYNKTSDNELIQKTFGNIDTFLANNSHVLYPKFLSKNFQRKILRILYLYGIPKQDGIDKIINILGYKSAQYESIRIFIFKVLFKCLKFQPELIELIKTFPPVDGKELQSNRYVDIRWIKEEAIESISSNVLLFYKVRDIYLWFDNSLESNSQNFEKIGLKKWTDVSSHCSWWSSLCDRVLFKVTAFYGFLFNSVLAAFIYYGQPNYEAISLIKKNEAMNLEPAHSNPEMAHLGPVLKLENKKKRIIEIIKAIEDSKKAGVI